MAPAVCAPVTWWPPSKLIMWLTRNDDLKDLRCMSFTSKGTQEILAAGLQDQMFVIDLVKGEVVKKVCSAS
jgi:PAB-dependent poly(A)-specific ribonuclease subunit 2